jgi:hypothetical protein
MQMKFGLPGVGIEMRMFRKGLLLLALLSIGFSSPGQYTELKDLEPLPVYTVKSTRQKMKIDGALSEAWGALRSPDVSLGPPDR